MILDLGPDVSWADKNAWAPAIAERDGKYYFYFCAEQQIGVAVADCPAGPFKDALGGPLVAKGRLTGQMIDPAVFTDDDGQSYLYWGNGHGYVVPLNADMVSFDASQVRDITQPDSVRMSASSSGGARTTSCGPRTTPAARTTTSPTPPDRPRSVRGPSGARSCPSAPEYGIKGTGHHYRGEHRHRRLVRRLPPVRP